MEGAGGREGFPKRARLTKRSQFLTLTREGKRVHTSHFIVLTRINDAGETRLGITVTTRVGNAVARNRIKRLVREFYRRHRDRISQAEDIVVIAKMGAEKLTLGEVGNELRPAMIQGQSRQR